MASLTHSLCRACGSNLANQRPFRAFSVTAQRGAIPPEAPNFVDIPPSHQPEFVFPRRQKGILPVPRDIFPPRQPDKPSEDYIARATQDKKATNVVPETQMSDLARYRQKMAKIRKAHLKEGLTELYQRQMTMDGQVATRSDQRKRERARLISQGEREDERLTNATIPQAMRRARVAQARREDAEVLMTAKLANIARSRAEKAEERRDALHTLYMNARDFITTEEQLDTAIEKLFPAADNPEWRSATSTGLNIWNKGCPPTIANLLDATTHRATKDFTRAGMSDTKEKYRIDQERMKRIAEELSGGKL